MDSKVWQIESRSHAQLYTEDWHARLVALLGYRPRRVSLFAESLMFGALDCLSRANDTPRIIRLNSLNGAQQATLKSVFMCQTELPMPFTFLQSQVSQALAALVSALKWQGDASIVMTEHFTDFVHMTLLDSQHHSILLGHADELMDECDNSRNHWLYLKPCQAPEHIEFQPISTWDDDLKYLKLAQNKLWGAKGGGL